MLNFGANWKSKEAAGAYLKDAHPFFNDRISNHGAKKSPLSHIQTTELYFKHQLVSTLDFVYTPQIPFTTATQTKSKPSLNLTATGPLLSSTSGFPAINSLKFARKPQIFAITTAN